MIDTMRIRLLALALRCEIEDPSPHLDKDIWTALNPMAMPSDYPTVTSSVDAAVLTIPRDTYWHAGAGKLTADEPLYGAIIEEAKGDSSRELGDGESNKHLALAICAAACRAHATLRRAGEGA